MWRMMAADERGRKGRADIGMSCNTLALNSVLLSPAEEVCRRIRGRGWRRTRREAALAFAHVENCVAMAELNKATQLRDYQRRRFVNWNNEGGHTLLHVRSCNCPIVPRRGWEMMARVSGRIEGVGQLHAG